MRFERDYPFINVYRFRNKKVSTFKSPQVNSKAILKLSKSKEEPAILIYKKYDQTA